MLTVRAEEQTGKPDKKVYAITPQGRSALAKLLAVTPARDKYKSEFLFQMLLLELLPQEIIAKAYDTQIANLRDELVHVAECEELPGVHAGADLVHGYAKAVLSSAINFLESKRAEFLNPPALNAAE